MKERARKIENKTEEKEGSQEIENADERVREPREWRLDQRNLCLVMKTKEEEEAVP